MPSGSSRRAIDRACCSASSSVGAMIAAWIAVLHREQRGEQRDDRLAAADVALQQPLHAALAAHVGEDLAQHARLRARERERQRLAELRRELSPVLEADAAPRLAGQRLGALLQQLHEQQLLERQPRASLHRLAERRGAVHHAQRVARCAGTAAPRSTSGGRYSATRASSSSRCASMIPRMTLNESPSVAGYTDEHASLRRSPSSSSPRLTNSRGWSWRP